MRNLCIFLFVGIVATGCSGTRSKAHPNVQIVVLEGYYASVTRQESREVQLETLRQELLRASSGFRIVSIDLERFILVLQEM